LSGFDFEIQHVTDSKIKHLDELSRHVGLVGENQLISEELLIREHGIICFVKSRYRTVLQKTVDSLNIDGVLYRRLKGKQPKLVVPQSLIEDVIAENHGPIFVPYPGSKRIFEFISLWY